MKCLLILLMLSTFAFIACIDDNEVAREYKLELNYYNNALSFSELNLTKEAVLSCERTSILRSECFTSLAQDMLLKGLPPEKEICDGIQPEEKMQMTRKAFKIVYKNISTGLKMDIDEKLNPSKQRINTLNKIKEDCLEGSR